MPPENAPPDQFASAALISASWPTGSAVAGPFGSGTYFETSAAKYDWLNRIVAVGVGRRMPAHAEYDVFRIL